jgi:predicted AlkP superfamily phosphohydrolase/phosphomutase
MASPRKTVIFGLDGATFRILDPLLQDGVMPHLAQVRQDGVWGELESVIPTNSAPAWATFATGKNPGKHSVFEFRPRIPGESFRRVVVDSSHIRGETLWQMLNRQGKRVGVFNVPLTYPARPVDGFMITGMLTPKPSPAMAHPPNLYDELTQAVGGYTLDVSWMYYENQPQKLLRALDAAVQVRLKWLLHLLGRIDVDVLVFVFTETDRLQHALWRLLDESHPAHTPAAARETAGPIARVFHALDEGLGSILQWAGPDPDVFVISDHGFQPARKQFRLDEWLVQEGYLAMDLGRRKMLHKLRRLRRSGIAPLFRRIGSRRFGDTIGRIAVLSDASTINWQQTRAYCGWALQQGVSINLRGREPHGWVEPGADCECLRDEIAEALVAFGDPESKTAVVDKVLRREEYYRGPYSDRAPDLLLIPKEGYAVAPYRSRMFEPTGWASGEHSMQGIFLACGPHVKDGGQPVDGARLLDILPTVLHATGLPVPDDVDGRVLVEIFEADWLAQNPPTFEEATRFDVHPGDRVSVYSSTEDGEVRNRLRGLGYL